MDTNGRSLPVGSLPFPIAAAIAPVDSPEFLYVANSNFDLFYNSGSVQSYSLETLNDSLDDPELCAGVSDPEFCALLPRERLGADSTDCDATPPRVRDEILRRQGLRGDLDIFCVSDLLLSEVRIGSFADGMAVSPSGDRLYLPVRSDANLTFINIDAQGRMSCGGEPGTVHRCTPQFRSTDPTIGNRRDIDLPSDPVAVATGDLATDFGPPLMGDYVVLAHRNGDISLFVDEMNDGQTRPQFVYALDGFGSELVTIEMQPGTKIAWAPSAQSRLVARAGIAISNTSDTAIEQAFIFDAGPRRLNGVDTGIDTRDIRFDPRPDRDLAYVITRTPQALLIASTAERTELPEQELDVLKTIPVAAGPSRLQLAEFDIGGSEPRLLAFVSCFNAREVQIIDVDLGVTVTSLPGVSGAFELQVDVMRERLYVIDFRTSVVRVLNLRPTLDCLSGAAAPGSECAPAPLGSIGVPEAIEELR